MNDLDIEKELEEEAEAAAAKGQDEEGEDDNNEEEIEQFFIDSAGLGSIEGVPHVVDGELVEDSADNLNGGEDSVNEESRRSSFNKEESTRRGSMSPLVKPNRQNKMSIFGVTEGDKNKK